MPDIQMICFLKQSFDMVSILGCRLVRIHGAHSFVEACESGKGWAACKVWCRQDVKFSCPDARPAWAPTLAQYADLIKSQPYGDAGQKYSVKSVALYDHIFPVFAVVKLCGVWTSQVIPHPPVNAACEADYTYILEYDGNKISHITMVWDDHDLSYRPDCTVIPF